MNYNFLKEKRILVTGHTGFIGSWLTKWLLDLGADVCGFSLEPPSIPNLYSTFDAGSQIEDIRGDIRDLDYLQRIIAEFQPEIVFHLAAQPLVLESYDNPSETFDVNVMGTVNLLECLWKTGSTRTILVMTSDKVYKNNEKTVMFVETDSLGGQDPYSASKSAQDIVVNSFRESYFAKNGIGVSSIRAGNVIGGGDWGKDRLIPDIVRGLSRNEPFVLRSPGSTRPWQYVLDLINGLFHLTLKMQEDASFGSDWNFGPLMRKLITVREIADKAISIWENGEYSIARVNMGKEARHLGLDADKAMRLLNWRPQYDFDTGLNETLEWYKRYYQMNEKMDVYSSLLIKQFMTRKDAT